MYIVEKIMIFVLMLSILYSLKYVFDFAISFLKNEKFNKTDKQNLLLGLALSYILTIIFTGFKIY